jgi:hypothetical protein
MDASTRTEHTGRVLVVRGSPDRATADVAEAVADELRGAGLGVDLAAPAGVRGLAGYRAVVVGSRLRLGHWHPAVGRWLRRHAPVLCVRPLWLFQVDPRLHRAAAGALTGLVGDAVPRSLADVLDDPATVTFHPDGAGSPPRNWARTIALSLAGRDATVPPEPARPETSPEATRA